MTMRKVIALALLFVSISPTLAVGDTGTFPAVKDTEIDSLQSGTDCSNTVGQAMTAQLGRVGAKPNSMHRYLVHFDLSTIPDNSTITAATLRFFVEQTQQPSGASWTVEVDRVTHPLWVETDAKWLTYDCDANAAKAFAWCVAGADFTAADKATWTASAATTGPQTIDILALVKKAVGSAQQDGTGGQLHLVLRAASDDTNDIERWLRLRTKDFSVQANRPAVDVTWTPPPGPTPTPAWVTFRDETSKRLNLASCTELQPARPLGEEDRMEKDIVVGDFDRDGFPDILVVRKEPFDAAGARKDLLLMNEVTVSGLHLLVDRSNKLPLLADGSPTLTDARDVFVGDLDGDGWGDLVIATTCNTRPKFYRNRQKDTAGTWLGFEDKTDAWQPNPYLLDGMRFCAVAGGDVDGSPANGQVDLYLSNYDRTCFGETPPPAPTPTLPAGSNKDHLLISDLKISGKFIDDTTNRLGSNATNLSFGTAAEIRDIDNDGKQDVLRIQTPNFQLLRNAGNPSNFTGPVQTLDGNQAYMFTAGDLTNDGFVDFYTVLDGSDHMFVATPHPAPTPPSYVSPLSAPSVGGPGTRTAQVGGNVKMAKVDSNDLDLDLGVADVDAEFKDSCNVCCSDVNSMSHCAFANVCSRATTVACTFPNHDTCAEDNLPGTPTGNSAFALVRNTGSFTANIQDPWPDTANQNFHRRTYDFAFLDINGDGCMDLFQGLCKGYKVFIQNCLSTGTP